MQHLHARSTGSCWDVAGVGAKRASERVPERDVTEGSATSLSLSANVVGGGYELAGTPSPRRMWSGEDAGTPLLPQLSFVTGDDRFESVPHGEDGQESGVEHRTAREDAGAPPPASTYKMDLARRRERIVLEYLAKNPAPRWAATVRHADPARVQPARSVTACDADQKWRVQMSVGGASVQPCGEFRATGEFATSSHAGGHAHAASGLAATELLPLPNSTHEGCDGVATQQLQSLHPGAVVELWPPLDSDAVQINVLPHDEHDPPQRHRARGKRGMRRGRWEKTPHSR